MMKSTPYAATAAGDLPHCNLRLGAALVMRSPGARKASLGSGSPQTPPEAGPVAATRPSEAIPRRRAGCPAPSSAGSIMTPKRDSHGQNELSCPDLLPYRSPPG